MAKIRLMHYTNQFFAGLAGEERADLSVGSRAGPDREFELEAPARVIGVGEEALVQLYPGAPSFSPWGALAVDTNAIAGACDWWGESRHTRVGY